MVREVATYVRKRRWALVAAGAFTVLLAYLALSRGGTATDVVLLALAVALFLVADYLALRAGRGMDGWASLSRRLLFGGVAFVVLRGVLTYNARPSVSLVAVAAAILIAFAGEYLYLRRRAASGGSAAVD